MTPQQQSGITLAGVWAGGQHDVVISWLAQQEPLVAAYVALVIVGYLTMQYDQEIGTEFIKTIEEAIQ